jgi:ATP-dependent Lon protease
MKESAQAAMSFARSHVTGSHEPGDELSHHDIHVHVPAGSVPKDGPSAGITLATAMVSLLTGRPVSRKVAMTGEITLRGDVLPIGGLKEKVLAARSAGVHTVVLPRLNQRDLQEVPADLRGNLDFKLVDHMSDVLKIALLPEPAPQ